MTLVWRFLNMLRIERNLYQLYNPYKRSFASICNIRRPTMSKDLNQGSSLSQERSPALTKFNFDRLTATDLSTSSSLTQHIGRCFRESSQASLLYLRPNSTVELHTYQIHTKQRHIQLSQWQLTFLASVDVFLVFISDGFLNLSF